jgi:predicted ATPase
LFVDRAVDASPGFALTDANASAVAALCQRLDGLPLAIELAASRVRSFPPAELVEHLDQRFELLSGGARTVLPRHRTLRAAIDWSYDLLGDEERDLFDRLAVFPADFDYDAVEAVRVTSGSGGGAVVRLLPALVDKSLVSAAGDTPRYRLPESLRAYAAERLAASGADTGLRQRHAAHYLALAEVAARGVARAGAAGVAGPPDDRAAQPACRAGPQRRHRGHRNRPTLDLGVGAVLGRHGAASRSPRVDPPDAGVR